MTRSLSERLTARQQLLGGLVRMPNEQLVELIGMTGMQFVVIDGEHGAVDTIALHHHLAAAQAVGLHTIVRIGSDVDILRALDLGADGVLAPHVSSVDRALELVRTCLYPPLGQRGFAAYTRAARYGLRGDVAHRDTTNAQTVLIVMIEDAAGLAAAGEIAAVPGVSALMLGPADLAAEQDRLGAATELVDEARLTVREACRAAGIVDMSIISTAGAAAVELERGAGLVVYNLQAAVTQLFATLAAPASVPAAAVAPGTAPDIAPATDRVPLVLLSGMLATAKVWAGVVSGLPEGLDVRHARIDLDDTVEEMARNVLASAPPRFAVAGHSLGGIVAMEVIRQAPTRVAGMALFNTSGGSGSPAQLAAWNQSLARIDAGEFGAVAEELAHATVPPERADLVERNLAMAAEVGRDGLRRQLQAQIARPDARAHLPRVAVPVLVVSGDEDEVSPTPLQEELVRTIPGARHLTVADCAHLSPLERPEQVLAALEDWWQTLEG